MNILNTSWKAEAFHTHFQILKNTLFGGIWPSPSWWAEAQEAQSISALQRVPSPGTQRVIHKQAHKGLSTNSPVLCHPTWEQEWPIPPTANRAKYFREVTVLAPKKTKKQTTLTVWCEAQTQVQVAVTIAGQSWLKPEQGTQNAVPWDYTHAHPDWAQMGISGRDGRTATVSDASSGKEELASASQASSHLQSPEVQEQESLIKQSLPAFFFRIRALWSFC